MKKSIVAALSIAVSIFMGSNVVLAASNASNSSKASSNTVAKVEDRKIFVTPKYVKDMMDKKEKFVLLEASWGELKDAKDYNAGHIPGAIHVNTDTIESEEIWNIRTPEEIEKALLANGITKDTTVVLYATKSDSAVTRVAYAYLWAGVENVKIINGGLEAWKAAGYEVTTEVPKAPEAAKEFGVKVPAHPEYWISIDDVQKKLAEDKDFKLVSIRSYDEFIGKTSGYSYIKKAGEPKGAVWGLDEADYINKDGSYMTLDQMEAMWKEKGLDFTSKDNIAFYCGTGWRATVPFLIMYENGLKNVTLYDGGWNQWQMNPDLPVQIGDPKKGNVEYKTVKELSDDKAVKKN